MNIREECELIRAALEARYPTGYPVYLEWHQVLKDKHEGKPYTYYADTARTKRGLRIRMSIQKNRLRRMAHESLIHEWVHAMDWKGPRWENHPANDQGARDHPPAFWSQYGEIYEWFFHQGGRESIGISGYR